MFYFVINPINEAWAFTKVTFTLPFNSGNNQCFFEPSSNQFFCVSNTGAGSGKVLVLSASNGALTVTWNLLPMFGNVTNPSTNTANLGGVVNSIWCDSIPVCYTSMQVAGNNPHNQLQAWNNNGAPMWYLNYSNSNPIESQGIVGLRAITLDTIYIVVDSGINRLLKIIQSGCRGCNNGSDQQMFEVKSVTLSPTNVAVGQLALCTVCGNSAGTDRVAISYKNSGGGFVIDTYNVQSGSLQCTSALGSISTLSGAGLMYTGNVDNRWAIADSSGDMILVNRDACTVSTTINSASITANSNAPIRSLGINLVKGEYYAFYNAGGATQATVSVMNLTSPTNLIQTLSSNSNNPPYFQAMAIGTSNHQVLVTDSSTTGFIYFIDGISGGGGGGGTSNTCGSTSATPHCSGQIDCDLPQNQNIAQCYIVLNPKTNNGFSGTAGMLNQSVSSLSCAIGLVKCNFDSNGSGTPINGDVKTNGIGYLIAIIGLAILISIFWVAGDHDLRNIPTFVWFIAVLGLLGAMVALGWLDPTFFILAIIGLVALGAVKAKGLLVGDSF